MKNKTKSKDAVSSTNVYPVFKEKEYLGEIVYYHEYRTYTFFPDQISYSLEELKVITDAMETLKKGKS